MIKIENNVYNVGDKVRVLMKALDGHKSGHEYIGEIADIQETFLAISNSLFTCKVLYYKDIDRMRFVRDGEDFNNTWNFDD